MELIPNRAVDGRRNITFVVLADRQLTPNELERAVRVFCSMKRVKKNSTYEFVMTPGAFDSGPLAD
jgi:hypothetical protein